MQTERIVWQVWGIEPGENEKVLLAELDDEEFAKATKEAAEKNGTHEVEIRIVEKQKPAANPVCPTCKGEGVIDLPFGGCQPCPDCQKQE